MEAVSLVERYTFPLLKWKHVVKSISYDEEIRILGTRPFTGGKAMLSHRIISRLDNGQSKIICCQVWRFFTSSDLKWVFVCWELCNTRYPYETHLNPKSREISYSIYYSVTQLFGNFKAGVMDGRDLKMNFGRTSYPLPWASVHWLVQCTLECHWLTQCTLGYHWATQQILAGYTGTPLEKLEKAHTGMPLEKL